MKRKRIRERIHLQQKINVFNEQTKTFIGYLVDISDMGISLVGKHAINVNDFLKLSIELPEPVNDRKLIKFDGLCVWSQPQPPEYYLTGFQMLNIKPEDKKLLIDMVDQYRKPAEED